MNNSSNEMNTPPVDFNRLTELLEKTFADKKISQSEKKKLSRLLREEYILTGHQRNLLRNRVFEIARNGMKENGWNIVLDWLEDVEKILFPPCDGAVYFSPGSTCREAIIQQLHMAIKTVDICVFTISDNEISRQITACVNRGLTVRIISDNEKMDDIGSDIDKLMSTGVDVRVDYSRHHMHHKFVVFDETRVLTGSYNWTRSAAEYNQENILYTDDQRIVLRYLKEFERLWDAFAPRRM